MSTPFSDDSLLPKPEPAMPVSPHGDEYLLRSERAQWEKRAAVAADASSDLNDAILDLQEVGHRNAFGNCVEGESFYKGLVLAMGRLTTELDGQSARALRLSRQCKDAASSFENADAHGAANLEA
ncbi:hypothetical protein SAMN04488548_134361 [Gordonia westfalica]|uniref:Excreted virulence factor EspC, type VII ESX diderm n=1 Tax=Gordonia westfalica TaxID=158898 RepID=A0A1H2HAJ7_9ACTN|nr:hypothetical protein SAMN04488548_134361 [Gordonia westfalica]